MSQIVYNFYEFWVKIKQRNWSSARGWRWLPLTARFRIPNLKSEFAGEIFLKTLKFCSWNYIYYNASPDHKESNKCELCSAYRLTIMCTSGNPSSRNVGSPVPTFRAIVKVLSIIVRLSYEEKCCTSKQLVKLPGQRKNNKNRYYFLFKTSKLSYIGKITLSSLKCWD